MPVYDLLSVLSFGLFWVLCCQAWAFSSCAEQGWGATLELRGTGFWLRWSVLLGSTAPSARTQYLWYSGLVAPRRVESPRAVVTPVPPTPAGGFSPTVPQARLSFTTFRVRTTWGLRHTLCLMRGSHDDLIEQLGSVSLLALASILRDALLGPQYEADHWGVQALLSGGS